MSTKFALSLLRIASKDGENFVISPFSLGAALAIIHDGAKEDTQRELTQLLGINLSASEISSLYSSLTSALNDKNSTVITSVANRFFLDKEFTLKPEYQTHIEEAFNAGAENIDFEDGDGSANIDFMRAPQLKTRYSLSDELTVVSLYYSDPSYSLALLMPSGDFGEWRDNLTAEQLSGAIDSLKRGTNYLEQPKFKIESITDGREALEKLRIIGIFGHGANLSGISDQSLSVSKIVHKAVIEVSEEGTEAAAATQIAVVEKMMVMSISQDLIFDRPFLYVLLKEKTVLFLGVHV